MFTKIPYVCDGEILEVQPTYSSDSLGVVRYLCKVYMPDGSFIDVPDVIESCMFGGIGDFFQKRSRSNKDAPLTGVNDGSDFFQKANIGEKVLIAFISGSVHDPIIIGRVPHPGSPRLLPTMDSPSSVFQYLGLRVSFDDAGQVTITRHGAPQTLYLPGASSLVAAPIINLDAPALLAQSPTEQSKIEMLSGGILRVTAANGGMVEVGSAAKGVYLSSLRGTGIEPAFIENITFAGAPFTQQDEHVWLDQDAQKVEIAARKSIDLYSNGTRNDYTVGDDLTLVQGKSQRTIIGDQSMSVGGNWSSVVGADMSVNTVGAIKFFAAGGMSVTTPDKVEMNAVGGMTLGSVGGDFVAYGQSSTIGSLTGATLKLANGTVALGGPGGELLDIFNQLLTEMQSPANQPIGNLGFPTTISPSFAALLVKIQATLISIKGSL